MHKLFEVLTHMGIWRLVCEWQQPRCQWL